MKKEKQKKCSLRCPAAEKIDGVPYMERWVIYCNCGCTVFGNSALEAQGTWFEHVEGRL